MSLANFFWLAWELGLSELAKCHHRAGKTLSAFLILAPALVAITSSLLL